MYDHTTVQPTIQGATFSMRDQLYHGHYLMINPLHRHTEVANENPLILLCTLTILRALVLLKRRAGKKKRQAPLLGLPKFKYYPFKDLQVAFHLEQQLKNADYVKFISKLIVYHPFNAKE